MFPFHTWLPAAHVEAPTAGSVLLASVLLKMGTYGFLRFSLPITPYATQLFTPYILWLSVAAILYGGLTALAQTDLKKLVAYSSVAHMGFATLGIFALNQLGIEGAVLVMINHGVTTGALFIVVGIIYERLHTRDLAETAGMGKTMPIFAMFAGVFALSSLAFPGTNSFIGEFLVMSGGFKLRHREPCLHRRDDLHRARRGARRRLYAPHVAEGRLRRHEQPRPFPGPGSGAARDSHPHAAAGVRLLDRPPSRALYPRARRQREAPARPDAPSRTPITTYAIAALKPKVQCPKAESPQELVLRSRSRPIRTSSDFGLPSDFRISDFGLSPQSPQPTSP